MILFNDYCTTNLQTSGPARYKRAAGTLGITFFLCQFQLLGDALLWVYGVMDSDAGKCPEEPEKHAYQNVIP